MLNLKEMAGSGKEIFHLLFRRQTSLFQMGASLFFTAVDFVYQIIP